MALTKDSGFDPNVNIDVRPHHREDVNPNPRSPSIPSFDMPDFNPNFRPIEISGGRVTIPSRGSDTGVSGYSSYDFWEEEQQRAAEEKAAQDVQRRKDDERERRINRETSGLNIESALPIGIRGLEKLNDTFTDHGLHPQVDASQQAQDMPNRELGIDEQTPTQQQFANDRRPNQAIPFNTFDYTDSFDQTDEDPEYEEAKSKRIQKDEYDKTSSDAERLENEHKAAADEDAAKLANVPVMRNDDDYAGKPSAFMTLVRNTADNARKNLRGVMSNRRYGKQGKRVEKRFSKDFKSRARGEGIFAQMVVNPRRDLKLHQVGVGWREISELVTQAPEMFEQLLRSSGCEFDTIVPDLGDPVDIAMISNLVNHHEGGVWVAVAKSPEVDVKDIERMQLVILNDMERGIAVHPLIAPMFNADFDGDQAFIFMRKWFADHARSVMDYIVDWDGYTKVSEDWIPSTGVAKGTDVVKFVRECIFDRWNKSSYDISRVVKAMAKILDNEFADPKKKMAMWGDLFRMARDAFPTDDISMSNMIESAYVFVRDQAYDELLHTSGTIIGANDFAQPKTDEDFLLFDVVERLVNGTVPNNWSAFRRLFHSFPGNIDKKNPPFRFNGDVGRSIAINDQIRSELDKIKTDDGDYEVVSDKDWDNFHKAISKYVAARRMSLNKERDERWQAARDAFRSRVIRRIVQMNDPDSNIYSSELDLSSGYPDPARGFDFEFIEKFVTAYNIEVERANQANARWSDRYEHVEWGNQKPIEVDRNGLPVDMTKLAEPLLEVYPKTLTVKDVFVFVGRKSIDPRWEGNPDHVSGKLHPYENETTLEKDSSEYWMYDKYDDYSLIDFSRNNRIIWNKKLALDLMKTKYSDLKKKNDTSKLQHAIMLAIADRRTAAASTFATSLVGRYNKETKRLEHTDSSGNTHFYDPTGTHTVEKDGRAFKEYNRHSGEYLGKYGKTAMDKFADLLCELVELDRKGIDDRSVEIEAIVWVVSELFPDMASRFHMDTVEDFSESPYGKKFMELARKAMSPSTPYKDRSKLVDYIASTWVSMVFDDGMDEVYRASRMLANAKSAEETSSSTNALAFAWDRLANKSEVWRGITKEIRSDGSAWKALHKIASDRDADSSSLLYPEYWKKHESGSIVDVIHDSTILYGEKIDIIADIVRWQTDNRWIGTYEIPFGMRIADNQVYSLSSANRKSAMGDITDFSDAFSSYAKTSRYNMHKEVMDAKRKYDNEKNRGRLLRTIRNMNKMPWLVRKISDKHYSSVFIPILDKTTEQQEKGSQASESNYAYTSTSESHNDGPTSDLYQTDGRVIGLISIDDVGISDFLKVLSDPDESFAVYNDTGAIAIVNAGSLLFGDFDHDMSDEVEFEERLWEFLEENPRVASMLRLHEMCSSKSGDAWVGSSKSLSGAISFMGNEVSPYKVVDHAKYLTEDHPGFASILVLCDPIGNKTSRSYPKSVEATRNYLLYRMCQEAKKFHDNPDRNDPRDAAVRLLKEFGVDDKSMVRGNIPDYVERLERLGMATESDYELSTESEKEALELYDIAVTYAKNYIVEISEEADFSNMHGIRGYEKPRDIKDRKPDRESILAFIDINQELGASKTARSTAVNGMTTFNHVEWVRFIDAQDKYVDIDWLMKCAEIDPSYPLEEFDGVATSVLDDNGNFIPLEVSVNETVDDDGKVVRNFVTNYSTLKGLVGEDEQIVVAGDGRHLRDRSTRKDGKVMPALFKHADSKRSKGSEALNLKLKKFGLDVLDSIIKMKSKHRKDMNYLQMMRFLNDIYAKCNRNMMAVHLALGHQLYDAARDIGYDDLTLSDFTCIASLMTIVSEDGNSVYVRSIEQLSNAIRYAVSRLDHKPDAKEMYEIVNEIVNDNSINGGVGVTTFDASEAFDRWRPAKKAFSALPTRHVSSSETRNHEMLDMIEKEQYDPSQPSFTTADAERLRNEILYKERTSTSQSTSTSQGASATGTSAGTSKEKKTEVRGVKRLKDVFSRCKNPEIGGMARDYIPIGGIGVNKELRDNKDKLKNEPYRDLPKNAIGPMYAYIVGDGAVSMKGFQAAVDMCYQRGITMIVSKEHIDLLRMRKLELDGVELGERGLVPDALEASTSGDVIIPFFDMRLNGSDSLPTVGQGALMSVPSYGMYYTSYESKRKMGGDAEVTITRHCARRTHLVQEGDLFANGYDLFPNVYNSLLDFNLNRYKLVVREATPEEVSSMIVNSNEIPTIDVGMTRSNSIEFQQHVHDIAVAYERYKDRWISLGGNVTDTVSSDLKPGDIVSWQICEIVDRDTNDKRYVFAPVIPFPLHGPHSVPPVYSITSVNNNDGTISISYKNESGLPGNTVKIVDPMSGACKGVAYVPTEEFADPDDDKRVLKTGTMIDWSMEEAATSSRKEGTDKRLKTLVTLMVELRKQGFNFGKVEGAFPNNPEIAERLGLGKYEKEVVVDEETGEETTREIGRITRTEWKEILSDREFKFSNDKRINKFLWVECTKFDENGWNPSDFMSNLLDYNDGKGLKNSGVVWEFETTLDPRPDYENDLLHFFHTIDARFCPDGIDDMSEDHYFRMWRSDSDGSATGYDAGQVQMEVPDKDSKGVWYYLWHNVYSGRGFFTEHTTMLNRPDVTTAEFNPSAAHAMSYTNYGLTFEPRKESIMLDWALSGMSNNWDRNQTRGAASAPAASVEPVTENVGGDAAKHTAVQAGVPNVSVDDVENVAGEPSEPNVETPVSMPTGKSSFIMSGVRDSYKDIRGEARTETSQKRVSKAKEAFVRNKGKNRSYNLTDRDIAKYNDVPVEELVANLGLSQEDIEEFESSDAQSSLANFLASHREIRDDETLRTKYTLVAAYKWKISGKVKSTGSRSYGATDADIAKYKDVPTEELLDHLGIGNDDVEEYLSIPDAKRDIADYIEEFANSPELIADMYARYARIATHKWKVSNKDYHGVTDSDVRRYEDLSPDELADYLDVDDVDIRDYLDDTGFNVDFDEYVAENNIDIDQVEEYRRRMATMAARLEKYGGIPSTGVSDQYDIDFDNYEFTGEPISTIGYAVMNGQVPESVRNEYIFQVEMKKAEDGGYLDSWLNYWMGYTVEDQLRRQLGLEGYLNSLRGAGVRTTAKEIMETEEDAKRARKFLNREELSYRSDRMDGIGNRKTREYLVSCTNVRRELTEMMEELKSAIDNVNEGTYVGEDGETRYPGYDVLLSICDRLDTRVETTLGLVPELPKIRKRAENALHPKQKKDSKAKKGDKAKKGSRGTANRDLQIEVRKDLFYVVDGIEDVCRTMDDLKKQATKILAKNTPGRNAGWYQEQEAKLMQEPLQKRKRELRIGKIQANEMEVEALEGWRTIGNKDKNPTQTVISQIRDAMSPRIKRQQQNLRSFINGDDGTARQKELARIGMKFIEAIEDPTRILTEGFHAEVKKSSTYVTKKDEKTGESRSKKVQLTEAQPTYGDEVNVQLYNLQKYIGIGGGRFRADKIAKCRAGLGIASDGTISHISADDFRISDRQMVEILKDAIAMCERGLSPTDLSDEVRGDPFACRDDSGQFVVIGNTKRYPLFMPWGLWYEICSDPTSVFYVEGENPRKLADKYFRKGIESWLKTVHNRVVLEGDVEQLISIDNLAYAVLSMDGKYDDRELSELGLSEFKMSLDIDAMEADAVRSDDPDMYIPLSFMINKMKENAAREDARLEDRFEKDNRLKQVNRTINSARKTSGTMSIPIIGSGFLEEGVGIVNTKVANALVGANQYASEEMTSRDPKGLASSRFNYHDKRFRKVISSRSFSTNMQVVAALKRIDGEDLLDLYISEKDKAGRAVNTKFTPDELNSFLVRHGYIEAKDPGSGVAAKAKNVTREAAAMAEKVMTDFAVSQGLPGFRSAEAQTFAEVYMSDARVLQGSLERHQQLGHTNEYAYAVDVNEAVSIAQTLGTGELVRKMLSTPTGREAITTMGHFGAGRNNAMTGLLNRLMWRSGITETLIALSINKYPCYGIGKDLNITPLSSTVCYLITAGYSEIGDMLALAGESGHLGRISIGSGRVASAASRIGRVMGRADKYQMGTRSGTITVDEETGMVRQRKLTWAGLRKNLIYDIVSAGSTLGKTMMVMSIIKHYGLTPPEDPDHRLLYEEWRIGKGKDSIPFKLAWWLDDLTGISVPLAMGMLVNEGGSWDFTDEDGNVVVTIDGGELAPGIIWNGIGSLNDGTSVFEAIELFTHWDEHWSRLLGTDALDKIGNEDGDLAPHNRDEWAIITTRNFLLDQFGQMTPTIINQIMPTAKDSLFVGDENETSPYLLWNTMNGKISLEEAKQIGSVTGVDTWSELTLRQITRKYWVIGKLMDIAKNPQTGYTWAEMPDSERIDKATYAKWKGFSFDFSEIRGNGDVEGYLTEQGERVYDHILKNYSNVDEANMDGFYLSYDALVNARAYCESKKNQLKIESDNARAMIRGIGGAYNEVKAKLDEEITRQYDNIKVVNDILWSSEFRTSVPKYNQQRSNWVTTYVDADGNPATILDYWAGRATKKQFAYGDVPNIITPITRPRQLDKGWNNESIPWNFPDRNKETEANKAVSASMYHDLVENGLVLENPDGTTEDLGKTYFGGTDSPEGLMLGPDDLATTGSRIDIPKVSTLPSFLRTKDEAAEYYKKVTGMEYGGMSVPGMSTSTQASDASSSKGSTQTGAGTGSGTKGSSDGELTGNPMLDAILREYGIDGTGSSTYNYGGSNYRYGGYRYGGGYSGYRGGYGGGGGGGSYNPKIYSTSRNVSARGASGLSVRSPYKATGTYLRPAFYTSGSRSSYLRMG